MPALTHSDIGKLICAHTGQRISLRTDEIQQHFEFAHAILTQLEAAQEALADQRKTQAETALQALVDQAQELDMGYGKAGLPSTPLPSFARLGRYGELSIPFRDWWTTPNSKTNVAPRNFMDENSARAAWFAASQQPVQAAPDGTVEYLMSELRSIADLEPVDAMLDPQWASRVASFALATVATKAAPGEPGQ